MNLYTCIHQGLDACDHLLADLPGGPDRTDEDEDLRGLGMDLVVRTMAVLYSPEAPEEATALSMPSVYRSRTGYELDTGRLRSAVRAVRPESDQFWRDMRIRAHMLPPSLRKTLLGAARDVSGADRRGNAQTLARLSRALNG